MAKRRAVKETRKKAREGRKGGAEHNKEVNRLLGKKWGREIKATVHDLSFKLPSGLQQFYKKLFNPKDAASAVIKFFSLPKASEERRKTLEIVKLIAENHPNPKVRIGIAEGVFLCLLDQKGSLKCLMALFTGKKRLGRLEAAPNLKTL